MSPKNRPRVVSLSRLTKLRLFLLYSFPAVLFCSYFPLIPIVSTASTNYELSLPLIWLFLFSVLSLKDFFRYIIHNIRKSPFSLLFFLFPSYLTLSALWSTNPLRALLAAGILWCIIIASITIFTVFCRQKLLNSRKFLKIFFFATTAFCAICWLQSILDITGVARDITLLCSGCTSRAFGFPHPSGFAIEPQFMGNLLLAPTLTALYLWTQPKSNKSSVFNRKTLLLFSFLFSATLFLTFSRGAIYSFALGLALLIILNLVKLKNRRAFLTIPLLFISAILVIFTQGLFSTLSYTNSTFAEGIEKSVSQMTLGQINLTLTPKIDLPGTDQPASTSSDSEPTTPIFDGYVEESTNTRMKFNRIALELSPKTPVTLLFGYGLGSAGEVMYQEGKTTTPYEIVQNEYLSLLLETGIIGLLFATVSFAFIVSHLKKSTCPERFLLEAVIAGFLFSLLFFSGLPNVLHLYLFPTFLTASFLSPLPSSCPQTRTYHTPRN